MIKLGVLGAGGRMGRAIIDAIATAPDCALAGGVERPGHPDCGNGIGDGMILCANAAPLARQSDVLIDFTAPDALDEHLRAAIEGKAAILIGTTGLGASHHGAIDSAARDIPVLQSANMSVGIAVITALIEEATRVLDQDWDIEILDWHHRHKVDAPSGTALALGEAAARGRGSTLARLQLPPHELGGAARRTGGIGFATLRGGSVAGEHQLMLATPGERIMIGHSAENRTIFAHGALRAARWLAGKSPGRYDMRDALGIHRVIG